MLVTANFADQKNRIEDEAGDYGAKENDAEKNFDALAPVEDDPAAADRERHRLQANPQREEEINRFLPADDPHRESVAGGRTGVRSPVQGVMGRMGVFRGCQCNGDITTAITLVVILGLRTQGQESAKPWANASPGW